MLIKPRVGGLDAARGLAVVAMFAFHFIWDLGHFGYIDAEIPYSKGVKLRPCDRHRLSVYRGDLARVGA